MILLEFGPETSLDRDYFHIIKQFKLCGQSQSIYEVPLHKISANLTRNCFLIIKSDVRFKDAPTLFLVIIQRADI